MLNIPIEDNCADTSLEEIKDTYFKYGKQRKPHQKKGIIISFSMITYLEFPMLFVNLILNFTC